MNPESKEFVSAGRQDGLSAPSTLAQSSQTQPESTEVKQHPWPIPSIVVTPFVNQLPQSELLGYNLNKKQNNSEMKRKRRTQQTSRPAGGMSLLPPGMSDSSSSSAGTRQMAAGGNGVIGSPASQGPIGFNNHASNTTLSNTTPQGGSMIAAYGQGQTNQPSYMTSVSTHPRRVQNTVPNTRMYTDSQKFAQQPNPGSNRPFRTSGPVMKSTLFSALASRAYQEAVKLPENPPPQGWVPGAPLEIYYEELLMRFQVLFQKILQAQGCYDEGTFRNEWLHHCQNIMENHRNEWALHPFGSVEGIKTTLNTKNTMAASLALRSAAEKATGPPPSDWKVGDELHPYYETMLARFERHLAPLIEQRRLPILQDPAQLRRAIDEYSTVIIREFRVTWFEMFPQ